ncbi:TonB-dependent siderophore receptor [Escherichia coli]|nr:TonB-dependent siderophore receptor [Escherichia coli]
MARSKTAQPKHSLRKIAVVVATAVSGMSVYAQAAVEPKEDTITVTAAPAPQESAWGPAATIAARQSATGTKTDTPIQKVPQSISVVTAEEMALHQPKSVKEALSYTPGVSVGTRGASNTYDHLIIRGFAAEGQSQNNYLNGLKLQGNFYNDAVIDPYMLERAEIMRGPVSVLYGKSSPGGLLNMVSKRPTTEPLKEVQFKAGTDSLFQTGFDFSDSLDDDGVYSYRLTGLARSANAQQKGSEEQRYAIAPAFTWRPDDKTNFTFLSYFQNEPETGYYGWLPKEGTVEPLPNGKRLPTDFNEGAKNNTYSRNEKMVGYSFDHEFNDTFTVRQNLRFAENKTSQNSVYGYGVCSDPANAYSKQCAALAPADKGKQYEVGVKYVPEDRPIVVTGAVYNLTKTNNLMADPEGSFFSVEGGEIRARGVEIEAKAALSASVNVVGSYTYTDAEYTTDTTYKGNTPAQVPKHMASLWADYTFFDGPLSGLTLGTGGRYTGSSYGDPANSFKVGSYTVVDALVRYDLARVGMAGSNVALHVNNLFDREYVASCFNTYGCFWGAERQVVATATFRF